MKDGNNNLAAVIATMIAACMTFMVTVTGCTQTDDQGGKTNSGAVTGIEKQDGNVSGTDAGNSDWGKLEDEEGKGNTGNTDKENNGQTVDTDIQKAQADESQGDTDMDPMTRMEYDRARLLAKTEYYNTLDNSCPQTWCFQRKKDHSQSGTYENFKIADYNGVYVDENVTDSDKKIYLTFDCGYPSDLTVKILDTLKKHNVKASFFVTQMYLEGCPEYAKRMKEEGHMVCNHTVTHTDLVKRDVEGVLDEIYGVAEYFYELTGYEFDPYLRTPTGSYSKRLMTILEDAGYMTVFWSIAYGDYDPKNQPAAGYVTDHFATYHHNGAIALMHNDSPSNANELDAVLTLLEKQGYRFALLDELYISQE